MVIFHVSTFILHLHYAGGFCFCLLYGESDSFLFLDIQEVFVGIDGEFAAGGLVAGDDGSVVHLQSAAGPLLADASLHRRGERAGFVVAADEDKNFFRVCNGPDTD